MSWKAAKSDRDCRDSGVSKSVITLRAGLQVELEDLRRTVLSHKYPTWFRAKNYLDIPNCGFYIHCSDGVEIHTFVAVEFGMLLI